MSEFKVGDRVYCPTRTLAIGKIVKSDLNGNYPLSVFGESFTEDGRFTVSSGVPTIFHATPANYELLSKLYPNVEFEKPKLTGSDLTRQMLADGAKEVLCWVSDEGDDVAVEKKHIASVVSHTPYKPSPYDGQLFTAKSGNHWKHAVPIPRNFYAMDESDE